MDNDLQVINAIVELKDSWHKKYINVNKDFAFVNLKEEFDALSKNMRIPELNVTEREEEVDNSAREVWEKGMDSRKDVGGHPLFFEFGKLYIPVKYETYYGTLRFNYHGYHTFTDVDYSQSIETNLTILKEKVLLNYPELIIEGGDFTISEKSKPYEFDVILKKESSYYEEKCKKIKLFKLNINLENYWLNGFKDFFKKKGGKSTIEDLKDYSVKMYWYIQAQAVKYLNNVNNTLSKKCRIPIYEIEIKFTRNFVNEALNYEYKEEKADTNDGTLFEIIY